MRAEKRYAQQQNQQFRARRSQADRKAYKLEMQRQIKALDKLSDRPDERLKLSIRLDMFNRAMLADGNRTAIFPRFEVWEAVHGDPKFVQQVLDYNARCQEA
jgi:hypothetical protein